MILTAFFRALGQLDDAKFRRVLLLGLGLTLCILIVFTAGFTWWISWLLQDGIWVPFWGRVDLLARIAEWGALALMLAASVFLMIPVASVIISAMLETIAQAVEDKHYPGLARAPAIPLSDTIWDAMSFLGLLVIANLFALILYAIFVPAALFIFWGMNGLLLGREYFTLAAMRRVGRAQAKVLRRRHFGTVWLAGILMAVPLTIPLLNLVIPIVGAATFTNLYHLLENRTA